ncbi:MAG: SIR2 family protein, partial [Candidatus Bathyarchaeia archaeon]
FELYWNPNAFKSGGGINLYKLHGSLYWFTTEEGKLIKIPLKKLSSDKEDMFYYSGKRISESMIYPAISKRLEGTPFSHLRETFKTKLLEEDLLIVVGYSFRDEQILSIVQDQFQINSDLWLVVVDLNPDKVKKIICMENMKLSNRTIALKMKTEEAFGQRELYNQIERLNEARLREEFYRSQLTILPSYQYPERLLIAAIKEYKK